MGQPFIGEIRMFGGNFAPAGWAMCQGQLQDIGQNDALFSAPWRRTIVPCWPR